MTNLVKIIPWILGFAMFIIFMTADAFSGCRKGNQDTAKVETKTEYVQQPPVYIPMYMPQQSGSTQYPVYIPQDRQPSADIAKLTEQYNQLVRDFLATKTYKDSITLRDSSGKDVGVVNLNDVVSENQLKSRQPSYQLRFPHTTTTITLTEPPKTQFYLGGGLTAPAFGATAGFAIKNKKDHIYQFNAGAMVIDNKIVPYGGASMYWKIKFK